MKGRIWPEHLGQYALQIRPVSEMLQVFPNQLPCEWHKIIMWYYLLLGFVLDFCFFLINSTNNLHYFLHCKLEHWFAWSKWLWQRHFSSLHTAKKTWWKTTRAYHNMLQLQQETSKTWLWYVRLITLKRAQSSILIIRARKYSVPKVIQPFWTLLLLSIGLWLISK